MIFLIMSYTAVALLVFEVSIAIVHEQDLLNKLSSAGVLYSARNTIDGHQQCFE